MGDGLQERARRDARWVWLRIEPNTELLRRIERDVHGAVAGLVKVLQRERRAFAHKLDRANAPVRVMELADLFTDDDELAEILADDFQPRQIADQPRLLIQIGNRLRS